MGLKPGQTWARPKGDKIQTCSSGAGFGNQEGVVHGGVSDCCSGQELQDLGCPRLRDTSVLGLGKEKSMGGDLAFSPGRLPRDSTISRAHEVTPGGLGGSISAPGSGWMVQKEQVWVVLTSASASLAEQQLWVLFVGFQESWMSYPSQGRAEG